MPDFTDFRSAKFQEICTHDVDLRDAESFRNEFLKTFSWGVVFSKKANFSIKSPTNSDFRQRWLPSDIDRWKLMTNWALYGMLTFYSYHWNQLKIIPWPVGCTHGEHPILKNTLLQHPVVVEKWRSITNSFAWRCHLANLDTAYC